MKPKKFRKNISFQAFFADVQSCRGTVYYMTDAGDQLNMKTTLSQLLFTARIAESDDPITGKIHRPEERDYELLKRYLID